MKFTKMQGCGNDYVYVNGFTEKLSQEEKPEIVRKLSDRHFGIGGDGVIFINPAEEADFEMEMYNADGSRSEMCGNGIRCVAKYVYDKGLTDQEDISIVSAGKIKYLKLTVEGRTATDRGQVTMVQVNMGQPVLAPVEVPVIAKATQQTPVGPAVVDAPITVDGEEYRMTCVSMGNPHAIVFMKGVKDLNIEKIGPKFEHHSCFPQPDEHRIRRDPGSEECIHARLGERHRGDPCLRYRMLRYGGGVRAKWFDGRGNNC